MGLASLAAHGNRVDLIVTHDCPTGLLANLYPRHSAFGPDEVNDYLQEVADTADFECWCFGHHHVDRDGFEDRRFHAMFDRVSLLDDLMGMVAG